MSGASTIGSGAVVLTANADALLSGLSKAQKSTEKWASSTQTKAGKAAQAASGSGGGGLLGAILTGGVAGGAAGGVVAAIGLATKGVEGFVSRLANIGETAKKYSNVDPKTMEGVDRATGAFDRMEAAVDGTFMKIAGALAPALEKIADIVEVVGFIAGEVFSDAVDLIGDIISEVSKWIDETFGLATSTTSAGDIVWGVFKFIAKAAGYAWDTIKAGAGVVAVVAGTIVNAFGKVVSIIGEAVKELDALARELPEAIRPDWIGKAAGKISGFGADAVAAGDGLTKWGKAAIGSFGETADKAGKYIDGLKDKFEATEKLVKGGAVGGMLSGAFAMGGAEAYSVVAKYTGALNLKAGEKEVPKKALEEAKKTNKKLDEIISDGPFIRIISW